ncbi:response regulator [Effusibacillus dendaii]|uniref:Response regulator n=1 Tax=Effusibacillus dendaii TaxID=2743772 RepID=A0A7I8DEL3_9BACL|nr:response regulator [Effusibacillus dendaii]BCJ87286.1 response regulator [Effusibacillus dendaii]
MKNILLVEDDILSAKLMQIVLTRLGNHNVIISESVDEILTLSRSGSVDLVIMDISLTSSELGGKPMNGLEITRLLKQDPAAHSIPVILASAHLMTDNAERIVEEVGADDYIPKPLMDHQILIEKVNRLLKLPAE